MDRKIAYSLGYDFEDSFEKGSVEAHVFTGEDGGSYYVIDVYGTEDDTEKDSPLITSRFKDFPKTTTTPENVLLEMIQDLNQNDKTDQTWNLTGSLANETMSLTKGK